MNGDLPGALECCERAIKLRPRSALPELKAEDFINLGAIAFRLKLYKKAGVRTGLRLCWTRGTTKRSVLLEMSCSRWARFASPSGYSGRESERGDFLKFRGRSLPEIVSLWG